MLAIFLAFVVGDQIAFTLGSFTSIAMIGAAVWTTVYVMLGYTFAGNVPQMSNLVASFLMTGVAAFFTLGFAAKLILAWRHFEVVIHN